VIRELDVASHAARAGAPVVPPSGLLDPGPYRHGGHVVTFWQYVEPKREVDPVAAGEGLRAIHEALVDYEESCLRFTPTTWRGSPTASSRPPTSSSCAS
jgi:hypothetical protein